MITAAMVLAVARGAAYPEAFADAFQHMAGRFGFTTPLRCAHFLATCHVESGGFTKIRESLTYSSATRIQKVFGKKRFPTLADAQPFVRNPQALANHVYGGRMGNVGPDDGWLYRGWGPGQITGRTNTEMVAALTGFAVDVAPALRESVEVGTICAMALWQQRGVHTTADADEAEATRRCWNGGTNGLPEFLDILPAAKRALGI